MEIALDGGAGRMSTFKYNKNHDNNMRSDKKAILFFVAFTMLMLSCLCITAETNTYAPVKQGETANIKQSCGSCSYLNVSIAYPNSSWAVINTAMTNDGGGSWSYTFTDTSALGRYDIITCGDIDGTFKCTDGGTLWFDVTPNGTLQTTSESLSSFAFLILVIVLTLIFGYVGYKFLDNDLLWPLGIFFIIMCFLLLIYNVWLLVEFKSNYTGSSPEAGITQTIFYIFMTILTCGFMTAAVLLFTKWKVIKDKFKAAMKPEEEDKDELI